MTTCCNINPNRKPVGRSGRRSLDRRTLDCITSECLRTLLKPGVLLSLLVSLSFPGFSLAQQQKIIVVVGAPGAEEYGTQFEAWADNWQAAIESGGDSPPTLVRIGLTEFDQTESDQTDAERLKAEIASTPESVGELWIVLIGHGTDDRISSKFNLRGPDVAAAELSQWLDPLPCRVVVINCASASGRFIHKLKHPNRIVLTATKSEAQHNFARFGGYLSTAIDDSAFDLDKDQQTSLLEAFISASSQTQEFYLREARLATELAMIDDNGDGLGTPADWFQGIRVVRKSKNGEPDGFAANQIFLVRRGSEAKLSVEQRDSRDNLEQQLERFRLQKSTMTEDGYYQAIEPILLKLSRLYQAMEDPVKQPQ